MLSQTQSSTHHERPYSNSLLLQFIMFEFIVMQQKIDKIHQNLDELLTGTPEKKLECLDETTKLFNKLAGSFSEDAYSVPFEIGIVNKLKSHIFLYLQNSLDLKQKNITSAKSINNHIDRILLLCLQIYPLLQSYKLAQSHSRLSIDTKKLSSLFTQLFSVVKKTSKLIAKEVLLFKDNENVIFFLLRHHKQIDDAYGPTFIQETFQKLFPKGISEIANFLVKKYQARGFDHLIPTIDLKFTELTSI